MRKVSAGLLMYRVRDGAFEVLLVHPGGPFWRKKDACAWTIPKGEIEAGEEPLFAAQREFHEETGIRADGKFIPLGITKLKSGKVIHAWAFEGNCDPVLIKSNTFELEWPPKSGKIQQVPEIDGAAFFSIPEAKTKINPAQVAFLDALGKACRHPG